MRLVALSVLSMLAMAVSLVSFSTPASAAGPAFVGYCNPDVAQPEDGSCVLDEPEGNNPDTYGVVTYDRTVAGAADSLAFDLPAGTNATEVQICLTLVADSAANPYVPTSANTCAGNSPDRAYSSSSPSDPVVVDVAAFFAANPAYIAGGALWFTVHVNSSGRTLAVTGGSAPGAPITRSLIVTKDVQPDGTGSFAFTVDCTTPLSAANTTSSGTTFTNGNASFVLADGEAIGFSGIADGDSCVVSEVSPGDGWATTANGVVGTSTTVSLAGTNGTAAFTNSPLRTLLVSKDVTGATGTHTFDFTVDCGVYALSSTNTSNTGVVFTAGDASFRLGDDESLSFVKIPHTTTCTVSETVPATTGGTWATSINGTSDADRAASVVLDQDRTLAYGNAFTADVIAVVAGVTQEAAPVAPAVLGVQVSSDELAKTGFAVTSLLWMLSALLLLLGAALLWTARRPQPGVLARDDGETVADVDALARWDADGGAPGTTMATSTSSPPKLRADANPVVRFLGLSALVVIDAGSGKVTFPLGILYPYTADLRRVCAAFDAADGTVPDASSATALLASIATLHSRIGFALGPSATAMRDAYRAVEKALLAHRPVPLILREASA